MIRANTVRDVVGIKRETGLPVIGLIKQVYEGYDGYITPTMREVDAWRRQGPTSLPLTAQTGSVGMG